MLNGPTTEPELDRLTANILLREKLNNELKQMRTGKLSGDLEEMDQFVFLIFLNSVSTIFRFLPNDAL